MSESNPEMIKMYTTSWCSDCHRAKYILNEYGVPFENIDVEKDEEGMAFVKAINNGFRIVPTIIFPDGSILVEPSNQVLADKLGLKLEH